MKSLFCLMLLFPAYGWAQKPETDTLKTIWLSEVMVQSTLQQDDTLQNFFRANKSATTEEILTRLQSVFLIRRGAMGQEPVIRGMAGGQVNVTIDGMKMFGACTDKMDPVTIYVEPQNLLSIDVKTGTDGVKLGSTVGGSVNMNLAKPQITTIPFFGKAGVGYQSAANAFNTYLNTNYSTGKSAYYFNANYRTANNYRAGGGKVIEYSQYNKVNFSASGKWLMGKDTLLASALVDEGWNIGYPAMPMDVGYAKARIYSAEFNRYREHNFITNLRTKVYYNTVHHSMDDTHRENVTMHMDMPGFSETAGVYAEGNVHESVNHQLSFRTDYYYNHVKAEMTMYPSDGEPMYMQTWPASSRAVAGIFVNDLIQFSVATKLNLNARLDAAQTHIEEGFGKDQLEVFYPTIAASKIIPLGAMNAKLTQLISKSIIADVHIGYANRVATLGESFGFYLFNAMDGYDYVGNPNLKTENNFSGDVTLSYYKNAFQLTATGFYNYFTHYIFASWQQDLSAMTPGAHGVKVYENVNSATVAGAEVSLLAALGKSIQLISAWKISQGTFANHEPMPLMPPVQATTTLRYSKKKFSSQLENESASKQSRVNADWGEDFTSGYSIFNVRASYLFTINKNKLNLTAAIENIFDKEYHNHLDWGNIPRQGRNLNISLLFNF